MRQPLSSSASVIAAQTVIVCVRSASARTTPWCWCHCVVSVRLPDRLLERQIRIRVGDLALVAQAVRDALQDLAELPLDRRDVELWVERALDEDVALAVELVDLIRCERRHLSFCLAQGRVPRQCTR